MNDKINFNYNVFLNSKAAVLLNNEVSGRIAFEVSDAIFTKINELIGSRISSFDELDVFLQWTEERDFGVASELRRWAKNRFNQLLLDFVLELSQFDVNELEGWSEARSSFVLHDVVRLRTNISGLEYTSSRPHQDQALWPGEAQLYTCWLCLRDMDPEMAPLRLYQVNETLLFPHRINEFNQLETLATYLENLKFNDFTLSCGDLLIFRPHVPHHALANRSKKIRWSLDFRLTKG